MKLNLNFVFSGFMVAIFLVTCISLPTLSAASSEPTLFIGGHLNSLAISPDGKSVYVVNDEALFVIDTSTNKLLPPIKTDDKPWAVAVSPDGKYVYTINREVCTVELDTPYVLPDGRELWSVAVMNASVSVISTATNTMVATVMGINDPVNLAVSPDGAYVYVLDNNPSEAAIGGGGDFLTINTATNSISSVLSFIDGMPLDLAVTPDGKYAYVTQTTGFVSVIDISTNARIARIPFGTGVYYVTLSPDAAFLYVTGGTEVFVVNTQSNAVVATISGFGGTDGMAMSPNGQYVYVTEAWNNSVSVINTNTNRVEYIISAGVNYPKGIVLSPDGKTLYVANNVYAPKKDCKFAVDYFGTVLTTRTDPNIVGATTPSHVPVAESSNSGINVVAQNVGNADSNTDDSADSFVPGHVLISCNG
jgi:YVTN family beta-propeller protein